MAVVGIDLGTTYSVVATMEDGRVVVIDNREGRQTTPSVVFFQNARLDDVIVGDPAVFSLANDPSRVVRGIKRNMGTDYKFPIDGQSYTPEEISAAILKKLKTDAEAYLNEAVTDAVITVPAYFGPQQRDATKRAGELAGLTVRAILAEPIAAAIDFAQAQGEDLAGRTVMVYDLGGGTFDVTVMRVNRSASITLEVDILDKDGSVDLGGMNWDDALADSVAENFLKAHGQDPRQDRPAQEHLLMSCQEAKEVLSSRRPDDVISVAVNFAGIPHSVPITRREFEDLTKPLLNQTADKTTEVVHRLFGNEPNPWDKIDIILLAGGSTKMPCVTELLASLSGKQPRSHRGVDLNVGRGAACLAFSPDAWTEKTGLTKEDRANIQAEGPRTGKITFRDVANHSVGVTIYAEDLKEEINDIVIKKGTLCNELTKKIYYTLEDNQKFVDIIINKGESQNLSGADVVRLGQVRIEDLPPGPKGQEIHVELCYDGNGLISGQGKHKSSGKDVMISVSLDAIQQGWLAQDT